MRHLIFIWSFFSISCFQLFANYTVYTANTAFFQTGVDSRFGIIGVLFTNFYSEALITNRSYYSVVSTENSNAMPIVDVFPVGSGTNSGGLNCYNAVGIQGSFDENVTNNVTFSPPHMPGITMTVVPPSLELNSTNTNTLPPIVKYIWNNGQFGVLPFNANGNNGFGLQYTFTLKSPYFFGKFYTDADLEKKYAYIKASYSDFELNSSGQFGLTSGNAISNAVQNSLTAEVDFKELVDLSIRDPWASEARPRDSYIFGLLVSPIGFEWNQQFSFGNYTPKVAFGGAIPYIDYPAKIWSSFFNITQNPGFPPTFFTGYTYVSPIASDASNPAVSAVRDRWDSELIYDFPLFNKVSFRFTWNSYIGLDRSLWEHYYQIGLVYYLGNTGNGGHGLFFGYAGGAQPPNFTKAASWRFGYSIQF